MKVKNCLHKKSISVKDSRGKSLGKLCLDCQTLHNETKQFNELRSKLYYKNIEKKINNPKFRPKEEFCRECKSKRFTKRKEQERIRVSYDKVQKTYSVNKQNPHISYKCLKCKHLWSHSFETPLNRKYLVSPKQNKETMKLILQHAIKEELVIPKSLSKLVFEVEEELRREAEIKKSV